MRILNRLLLPLVVALIAFASATTAIAQSSQTWMPAFDPDQHVYIDQKLSEHDSKPVSLPNLPAAIEEAQKVHNLKVYVVATEQGSESSASPTLAAKKLDELILRWSNDANFPKDDYLVIMWVRFKDDPVRGSVAANGGNRLRAYGMSASHFSSDSGPVIPVLKQHMRERPELALTTIIANVNNEVTNAIAAQQSAKDREEALKELPGILLKWGSILAALGLGIFLTLRFSRWNSRAKLLRNRFENNLHKVGEQLTKLKADHGQFLHDQSNWQTRFKGATLEKLTAGFQAYSELLSVNAAASARLAESDKARRRYWFPRIQGSLDAITLLSEKPIVVSSKAIELEMATLFGGVTVDKTVDPDDVFANGSKLFADANSALSEIKRCIAVNDSAIATVGDTILWVDGQHGRFEEERLTLAPYQSTLDQLVAERNQFKSDAFADPVTYILEVPGLTGLAAELKATIEEAFKIADDIEAAGQLIAETVKHVDQLRKTGVDYKFFGAEPRVLDKSYRLNEDGGNPDPVIHEAAGLLMRAFNLLFAGALDPAVDKLEDARVRREDAIKVIDRVFAAKAKVEADAHLVAETKAELDKEVKSARKTLAVLQRDFLPVNFPNAAADCADVDVTIAVALDLYAKVRDRYDRQLYLSATGLLKESLEEIASARFKCAAVEELLVTLTSNREDSRKFVPAARIHADRLGKLLKERHFTTSAATDADLAEAFKETVALEAIVVQPVANWADAHKRSTDLTAKLVEIETACDEQLKLYEETYELVGTLPADVESAYLAINENTLQSAREAHRAVAGELEALSCAVDKPKSDWKALHERAVKAHELCQTCRNQAAADDHNQKQAALHLAYCKVRSRRFARRKHKYLTEANRLYAEAQKAFAKRDWAGASKAAVAAYREFLKFDRHQKRRTATLVVKEAPGGGSASSRPTASGSAAASDDGYSTGIAIAIGMSMGSGNPQPTSSGSSSSSSSTTSTSSGSSYTPSYSSDTGGSSISVSSGGGDFGGGSGGGGY